MKSPKRDEEQHQIIDEEEQERMAARAKASAETVFYTAELMESILLNLPMQDLIRAQAVCCHWRKVVATSKVHLQHLLLEPCRSWVAAHAKSDSFGRWNSSEPQEQLHQYGVPFRPSPLMVTKGGPEQSDVPGNTPVAIISLFVYELWAMTDGKWDCSTANREL